MNKDEIRAKIAELEVKADKAVRAEDVPLYVTIMDRINKLEEKLDEEDHAD